MTESTQDAICPAQPAEILALCFHMLEMTWEIITPKEFHGGEVLNQNDRQVVCTVKPQAEVQERLSNYKSERQTSGSVRVSGNGYFLSPSLVKSLSNPRPSLQSLEPQQQNGSKNFTHLPLHKTERTETQRIHVRNMLYKSFCMTRTN